MAEQLTTIAAFLEFNADSLAMLRFSDRSKMTVGTMRSQVRLRQTAGLYPTATNVYVISEVLDVPKVRDWRGFEALVTHESIGGEVVTVAGFRLFDGKSQWWWNGAAWAELDVAGAGTIASTGTAVTGDETNFDPQAPVGAHIVVGEDDTFQMRRVTVRASGADTALTVDEAFAADLEAETPYRVVLASAGWNTEAEIAAHFATFPMTRRRIGAVVKLATTDDRVTPVLTEIRFAYDAHMPSMLEDLFFESLGPLLREQIHPVGQLAHTNFAGGDTFNLGPTLTAAKENAGADYAVVDLLAVYDITADPEKRTNLLDSYDAETKDVVLTGDVTAAHNLLVLVSYAPFLVMWKGAPDVANQEDGRQSRRLPLMWVAQVQGGKSRYIAQPIAVLNKGEGTAVVLPRPTVGNYQCVTIFVVPTGIDEARLAQEVDDFFAANPVLRSKATGETYRMQVVSTFDDATSEDDPGNIRSFSMSVLLHDVVSFHGQAPAAGAPGSVTLIETLNTRLS